MNRDQTGRDQRSIPTFRESDSSEDNRLGRFGGVNRFGEERIRHDSYQDDQYRDDYDPTYFSEYGHREPYQHGGQHNRWSDDIRSESSRENYYGRGPKNYQRSQSRIEEEACELLSQNRELDASEISVKVEYRCLYLSGEVNSRHAKRLAEYLVEDISGIDDVQNQIKISGVDYGY